MVRGNNDRGGHSGLGCYRSKPAAADRSVRQTRSWLVVLIKFITPRWSPGHGRLTGEHPTAHRLVQAGQSGRCCRPGPSMIAPVPPPATKFLFRKIAATTSLPVKPDDTLPAIQPPQPRL